MEKTDYTALMKTFSTISLSNENNALLQNNYFSRPTCYQYLNMIKTVQVRSADALKLKRTQTLRSNSSKEM